MLLAYGFKSRFSHQRDAGPNSFLGSALFLSYSSTVSNIFFIVSGHVGASFVSLAPFFTKIRARSRRCSSFPQKVTLAAAVRLQARIRHLRGATNFLRDARGFKTSLKKDRGFILSHLYNAESPKSGFQAHFSGDRLMRVFIWSSLLQKLIKRYPQKRYP